MGDTVRIYHTKKTMGKQQKSVWLAPRYTVTGIEEVNGQNFCRTIWNMEKPLRRPFVLKVPHVIVYLRI